MIKTFTNDDVIRYVYEETSEEENLLIEETMMAEPDLMTFFLDMLDTCSLLNRVQRKPREQTVQNILAYSQHYPNPPALTWMAR